MQGQITITPKPIATVTVPRLLGRMEVAPKMMGTIDYQKPVATIALDLKPTGEITYAD